VAMKLAGSTSLEGLAAFGASPAPSPRMQNSKPKPFSQVEEDAHFARAVKQSVDDALKLILAGGEGGSWVLGGLLRGTGLAAAIVDSLVDFFERRLVVCMESLDLSRLVCSIAKVLASHFRAEEAMLKALEQNGQDADGVPLAHLYKLWQEAGGLWSSELPNLSEASELTSTEFAQAMDAGIDSYLRHHLRPVLNFLMPSDLRELVRDNDKGGAMLDAAADVQVGGLGGILSALKEKVVLPQTVQALRLKVLEDLSNPDEVCRLVLKAIEHGSAYDKKGFGDRHAQAFEAVASVLYQLGSQKPANLRLQLMRELVAMHWGKGSKVDAADVGDMLFDMPNLERMGEGLSGTEDGPDGTRGRIVNECNRVLRRNVGTALKRAMPLIGEEVINLWAEDRVAGLLAVLSRRTNKFLLMNLIGTAAAQIALLSRSPKRRDTRKMRAGDRQWKRRQELFFGADISYVARYLGRQVMGADILRGIDNSLKALTLEHVTLSFLIRDKSLLLLKQFASTSPAVLLSRLKSLCRRPLEYVTLQMAVQRLLIRYKLDFSKELGPDGERQLNRQFTRYSWVFCEELITGLVRVRAEIDGEGANRRLLREDVIQEILCTRSDELMLKRLQKDWLPEVRDMQIIGSM
jgi:hypothetical protein